MIPDDKFIVAEKNGQKTYFLRNIWEKMSKADRRGWKELYVEEHKTLPPVDVIEFKKIQQEVQAAAQMSNPFSVKVSDPTPEEMKYYLQGLGLRISPNIGDKKLKERYYAEKDKASK